MLQRAQADPIPAASGRKWHKGHRPQNRSGERSGLDTCAGTPVLPTLQPGPTPFHPLLSHMSWNTTEVDMDDDGGYIYT